MANIPAWYAGRQPTQSEDWRQQFQNGLNTEASPYATDNSKLHAAQKNAFKQSIAPYVPEAGLEQATFRAMYRHQPTDNSANVGNQLKTTPDAQSAPGQYTWSPFQQAWVKNT